MYKIKTILEEIRKWDRFINIINKHEITYRYNLPDNGLISRMRKQFYIFFDAKTTGRTTGTKIVIFSVL